MRTAVIIAVASLVGIVVPAKQPIRRTALLQHDLAGMGKEMVVYIAEIAPRARSGRHYHRGHETLFILEGSGVLEVDGQPSRAVKAGDIAYLPPRQVHNAIADSTGPIKVLVFVIQAKGEFLAVPVD